MILDISTELTFKMHEEEETVFYLSQPNQLTKKVANFFYILKSPSLDWNGPRGQWGRERSLLFANVLGHESQDICLLIFNYYLSLYLLLAIYFDC